MGSRRRGWGANSWTLPMPGVPSVLRALLGAARSWAERETSGGDLLPQRDVVTDHLPFRIADPLDVVAELFAANSGLRLDQRAAPLRDRADALDPLVYEGLGLADGDA